MSKRAILTPKLFVKNYNKIKGDLMTKKSYHFDNLTNTQKECLAIIESLGVYELRALARAFGDKAPTTMKRDDHVVEIMNKIIAGEEIKPLPIRQGRPHKELSNIEGILAEISLAIGKDYTLNATQARTGSVGQKVVVFKQSQPDVIQQKLFPIAVRGILQENNKNELYFINQDNGKYIYVKKDIDTRLVPYDYIVGKAVIMNEEKEYVLDEIKQINFQDVKTYNPKDLEQAVKAPSEQLKIGNSEITIGGRHLIQTGRFLDEESKIKELVLGLKKKNITTIALIPNVMSEEYLSVELLGFDNVFVVDYDKSMYSTYETLNLFLNHIARLQHQGINLAVFVQDINTFAEAVDFTFKSNTKALMGHTEKAVEYVKKIVRLAQVGKDSSTTLISTLDNVDLFDSLYVSSVYKVSKKIEL